MGDNGSPAITGRLVASRITVAALLSVALVVGFSPDYGALEGNNFRRAVQILTRLWFFFTPAGTLFGTLAGYLILRSSWLPQAAVPFLRIIRWAPFLIWWVLAEQLTLSPQRPLPGTWLWTYGAVTVALTACYEFLVGFFVLGLSLRATLERVVGAAVVQGIFIALLLDMSIWTGQFWTYPGKAQVGYQVFITLAATILLINWATGYTFDRAATERGAAVVEELKCDNWNSFLGASALVTVCLLLWQFLTGSIFLTSPVEMLTGLYWLISGGELFRDIYVSFGEILLGLILSGGTAVLLIFVMNQAGHLKGVVDGLLQASHIAPIALLPDVLGLPHIVFYKWSALCVAVFCFHAFARAFCGLQNHHILPRTLLSIDEAMPYGATAIVYGEAMNATAGLSFTMVVAGATYQTAKGLASFVTLLFLVAALSTLLRCLAKKSLRSVTRN